MATIRYFFLVSFILTGGFFGSNGVIMASKTVVPSAFQGAVSNAATIESLHNNVKHGGKHFDLGPPRSDPKREWTIAVYIAGDNNLEKMALKDINEMERGIGRMFVSIAYEKTMIIPVYTPNFWLNRENSIWEIPISWKDF